MTLKQAHQILNAIDAGEPWEFNILGRWFPAGNTENPMSHIASCHEIRLTPKPEKWAVEKAAYEEGKTIERRVNGGKLCGLREPIAMPSWNENGIDEYRIAPSPTYIPLGPSDVPPGTVLRGSGETDSLGWCLITSCSETGIRLWRHCDPDYQQEITWETLFRLGSQILIPGEAEWKLCRKIKP